jgi:hypothetical protein
MVGPHAAPANGQYVVVCGQVVPVFTGQRVASLTHWVTCTGHPVACSGHWVAVCGQKVSTLGQSVGFFGHWVTAGVAGQMV